jgi:hypothetical protein
MPYISEYLYYGLVVASFFSLVVCFDVGLPDLGASGRGFHLRLRGGGQDCPFVGVLLARYPSTTSRVADPSLEILGAISTSARGSWRCLSRF